MLSALVEFIFSFLLEFVFESVFEALAELGIDALEKARTSPVLGPVVLVLFYVVLGLAIGGLSSYILPVHIIDSPILRSTSSVVSSIGSGVVLCGVSWFVIRKDRNDSFWSTAKFIQGVAFGLAYATSRAVLVG